MTAIDQHSAPHPPHTRQPLVLWAGVLGPPLLWLMHLQANYAAVPFACEHHAPLIVHGVTVAAIVLVAALGMFTLGSWRRAGREWPDSSGSAASQDRFLSATGIAIAALIVLALIAQWIPSFFVDPCQ